MKQIEANKNRAERLAVLQKIFSGEISLHQASIELGISYSQTKRIYALYKREGQKSLVHKNVGKRSNHRISDSIRETAVRLFKEKYYDFGPTSASRFMAEKDGIGVNHETLRRWLIEENLTLQSDMLKPLARRSMKRDCEGMLIRIRAVPCGWFNSCTADCSLAAIVDEATGLVYAQFSDGPLMQAVVLALKKWIITHGIPEALYFENLPFLYKTAEYREAKIFAQICRKLGIEIIQPPRSLRIFVYSSETALTEHNLFETRLHKELRVEKIDTVQQAQMYLETYFLPFFNKRFVHPAPCPEKCSVPLQDPSVLDDILSEHDVTAAL